MTFEILSRRLLAVLLMPPAAFAQALPDLGGRTVVVVTENAYPPLQFVDPKSGKPIGWEYDAIEEIAKRLNFKVEYQNTSWDAMIQAVSDRPVRHRHDRHHHQGRPQGEGGFLRSLHALGAVHAGARRREPLHRRQDLRARSRTAAGRRAGGHLALLHRRLQRARRQRAEPAHQAVRDLRRDGAGAEEPAMSIWC